jgi:hypothetical protein
LVRKSGSLVRKQNREEATTERKQQQRGSENRGNNQELGQEVRKFGQEAKAERQQLRTWSSPVEVKVLKLLFITPLTFQQKTNRN